jgi:hypothetical protein
VPTHGLGKVLYPGSLVPHSQILDSCDGQTLNLITKIRNLRTKKFCKIDTRFKFNFLHRLIRGQSHKTFLAKIRDKLQKKL